MEQPEIPLRCWTRLQILVEKREDICFNNPVRLVGRSHTGDDVLNQIAVILLRILQASARFVRISRGRPSALSHDHGDVVETGCVHGVVDGVDLGIEEVCIVEAGVGIGNARVGSEQGVVKRDNVSVLLVSEKGVGVGHKEGICSREEGKKGGEDREEVGLEGRGGGRVGGGEDGHGMGGGDLDPVEAKGMEGGMEVEDGRKELIKERRRGGEDLVSDAEGDDISGGIERNYVRLEPRRRGGGAGA